MYKNNKQIKTTKSLLITDDKNTRNTHTHIQTGHLQDIYCILWLIVPFPTKHRRCVCIVIVIVRV